ncbi:MAG: MG2 domain-containing protein, partial [Bacteroidota bacterium]|nr:MG2 domain-containing protein [Bacteroidota bacterium]
MKKKHIIFAICMIVFSTCLCRSAYAQVKKDYKSLWTKVDSLKAASRPQSVIAEVNKIYDKAKSEGNSEQKIKALLVLFNASKEIEEDAIPVFIHRFESELKDATEIEKAFLHSYLANMYKTYLDQNQWEIYERTVVEGGESGALESWDARKFENAIEEHYRLSIENVSLLANLKVQQYPVLIESPVKTILYRPTVLDALAQEALQYFKETHSFSTKPEPLSDVDDSTLFMPFDQFRNFNVENSQLENRIKWCLRIYQKLGAHLSDKGYEDAFLKTELDRIEFVYSQYTGAKRDSLYLNALDYLNGKAVKSQVGGDILLAKAHYYLERGDTFNANDPKTKVYQKDNKKAYAIYKEIEARYVGTSPAAEVYNCLKRLEQKDLSVKTEPNILPTESFPIHVSFKNIKNVTCRIYKVSSEFARYEKDRNAEVEKLIYKLRNSGQLVLTEQFELPEDGDLNTHTTELTLKGLPLGHYYLVFSSETSGRISKKPVALSAITVSGIGYTKLYNDQGVNVVVFDRQTGEALSGVKAQVWYKEWNFDLKKYQEVRGELLMSDQNGKILVIKRKGVQCFLELMNGADHSLTEKIYVPWFVAPENRAQEKTFFFTDRAIYKPGQTIYFKGIMLKQIKGSGEPIVQRTSQVVLYDANLRAIDSLKVISNKYGSFSGSYRLPDNILNGSFSIRNGPDYHSIQVEAYRQPSFEVKLKNPSEQYVLNKSVSVNGTVNAYHGGAISGAKVRYQIVRESLWRPLKRYNFTSVRIASGELVTDTTGKFVLSFPLKSDKSFIDDPEEIYQFRIEVQVTDVSGETRSTSSVLDATRKALEFQVSYPECLTKERMANTPVYTVL